jgi:hypothetical protein
MRITANSSLVLPSRRALVQDRLIAAHLGDPTFDDRPLSLALYPVGGTARLSQVLAQVRLPDGEAPAAVERTWDIGIEIVSGGVVVAHTSHRMAWRGKGQPPVYQTTVSIPSGPYEIVAVAREVATDAIREGRASGTWPEFSADRLTVSRSALAQPHRGGIVQDGEIRASGIVIRGDGDPIDPREPVAIVTAACVKGPQDSVLRAERELVGDAAVSFAPIELTPDGGRCVQIRDLVAARSLGAGRLAYYLRVFSGDVVIASQQVKFYVADVGSFPMTPGTSKSEDVAP